MEKAKREMIRVKHTQRVTGFTFQPTDTELQLGDVVSCPLELGLQLIARGWGIDMEGRHVVEREDKEYRDKLCDAYKSLWKKLHPKEEMPFVHLMPTSTIERYVQDMEQGLEKKTEAASMITVEVAEKAPAKKAPKEEKG